MICIACQKSRLKVRRRTVTLIELPTSSSLKQANEDRTRSSVEKSSALMENGLCSSLNTLISIVENEREREAEIGTEIDQERESEGKEERDDTQIYQPEDCGFCSIPY